MAGPEWIRRKQARKERRAKMNLKMQPRSPLGFIIKRDKYGAERLVFCCQRCLDQAIVERSLSQKNEDEKIRRAQNRKERLAKKKEKASK